MKLFWQIVCLFCLPAVNNAQTVLPLHADIDGIPIEKPYLYQLAPPPDQLGAPADLPIDPKQWQSVESINYGRKFYLGWARFSVRSEQARTVWIELATHFMDSAGVWTSLPNAPPQRLRGPSSHREQATSTAPVKHHYFLYALNLPAHRTATVWIRGRVVPGGDLKFNVRLWHPQRFLAMQQLDIWGWATFMGIILAILGAVLIAFMFYQRSIYLFYACYVACLSVYSLLNDGWGAFLPSSLAWFDSISTIVHWLNIGFGAFVLFSQRFLGVKFSSGRSAFPWPEFASFLLITESVLLAEWALQHDYAFVVKSAYILGYVGFMGYGGIWLIGVVKAFQQKSPLVWLLIAAVSTMLAFFFVNSFFINFGLLHNPLPDMLALRIALLLELIILSIGWFYRRKSLQRARHQLEIQYRHLQADVIHNQEAERQRIATDLHDDLGGTLATIRRRITDIRLNLHDAQAAYHLDDLAPLIQKSSDDLRRIAHNLMPPEFMRIGLRDSLRQLINSQPDNPTRFTFIASGNVRVLPLETELNIYRIISELVHNINKHAQAKQAALQLMYQDENLTITLDDDGLGSHAIKTYEDNAGIGLKNSSLRADYIGARLWREASQGGTLVVLDVPYSTTSDATRRPDPNPVNR